MGLGPCRRVPALTVSNTGCQRKAFSPPNSDAGIVHPYHRIASPRAQAPQTVSTWHDPSICSIGGSHFRRTRVRCKLYHEGNLHRIHRRSPRKSHVRIICGTDLDTVDRCDQDQTSLAPKVDTSCVAKIHAYTISLQRSEDNPISIPYST